MKIGFDVQPERAGYFRIESSLMNVLDDLVRELMTVWCCDNPAVAFQVQVEREAGRHGATRSWR